MRKKLTKPRGKTYARCWLIAKNVEGDWSPPPPPPPRLMRVKPKCNIQPYDPKMTFDFKHLCVINISLPNVHKYCQVWMKPINVTDNFSNKFKPKCNIQIEWPEEKKNLTSTMFVPSMSLSPRVMIHTFDQNPLSLAKENQFKIVTKMEPQWPQDILWPQLSCLLSMSHYQKNHFPQDGSKSTTNF